MKGWFIFCVNGEKIGTWANGPEEAKKNLRHFFGDVPMEYLGIQWSENLGPKADDYIYDGMSTTDMMIASGCLNRVTQLAR